MELKAKTYRFEIVQRKWDSETDREGPEETFQKEYTCNQEHYGRRCVILKALARGYLISHIRTLSVKDA